MSRSRNYRLHDEYFGRRGEFSAESDEAFERHLKHMKMIISHSNKLKHFTFGAVCFLWYSNNVNEIFK